MASAYGSNGMALVLVPKVQRQSSGLSSGSVKKAFLTVHGNARTGFPNAHIARRAGLVPHRKLERRAYGELGAMLKPVQVASPASVLSSKVHFSREVAVVHPYERVGRDRRLCVRMSVSCNARGAVDAVEEKRKVAVNVVDKEMILRPRAERAESFKQSSELDSRDDTAIDSPQGATTLTVDQEELEITISAEPTEVSVNEDETNVNVSGRRRILEDSEKFVVENDVLLVSENRVDQLKSSVELNSSNINSSQSTTIRLVDGEFLVVDRFLVDAIPGVDKSRSLEPMQGNYGSPTKNLSFGVKAGFVSKPQKKRNAVPQLKEAFSGIKRILAKDGEVVMEWARNLRKRTGVDNIIARDMETIQEAVNWVKELALPDLKKDVTEIVAMRILEDPSAVPSPPPKWPRPQYHELSGRALLAADMQTLRSYGDHVKEMLGVWRVPLQLCYNPDYVANYFNRRPHLLVSRFLEVAAAFSSVAVLVLIDGQKVSRDKSGSKDEEEHLRYTLKSAAALKDMLVGLGPTFIKVAQSLSSRPDLIGTDTAKVLSELQDRLAPFPTGEAMTVIEQELGVPLGQVFSRLSVDPVAAASFGQVYRGQTIEGQEVAVKVQRPDLLFTVARDIYILRLGLGLLRKVAGMSSDISILADELGRGLFGELDYTLEAANARMFETANAKLSYVKVPKTLPHLTRQRVLTMEWIDGFRPSDLHLIAQGGTLNGEVITVTQQREAKVALDNLVKKGVESSLVQLLETGVMHADPHPGNLLFTKDGNLTYLDFGLICQMEKTHQAAMLAAIAHLVNGEWGCLANDLGDMDVLKPTTDRFALRLALERVFGDGPDAVVKDGLPDINFGQVTGKLWQIALKFRLRLPPYYTLVLRSLASLEGIALSVDPDYKVFASAYPYVVTRLLTDNSHLTRQVLQSLVLNDKKELRWDRIASIVKTSQAKPSNMKGTGLVEDEHSSGADFEEMAGRKNKSIALLSFALSQKGSCIRRVIVEADTISLAKSFISAPASSYRRKVTNILSEAFYRSGLRLLNVEQEGCTGASSISNQDAQSAEEPTGSGRDFKKVLFGSSHISTNTLLKNRRLWFLIKVLAGKMQGAPFLQLKVGWTVMTMVCYAAAMAVHRVMVTLSDKLLSPESDKKSNGLKQSPARPFINYQ
ncbi:hypothetical protein Mapa_003573 [Marchantia paleacea]|nr:hypothetical protein Mapa_003573 [Marchantia paleacea]